MQNRGNKTVISGVVLSTLALAMSACAAVGGTSEYPNRPIELVVPYPAGGSADASARVLAQAVNDEGTLGARVQIVNRDGGAGTVGTGSVLNADPNGYTLGFLPDGPLALQPLANDLPYDHEALTPIVEASESPVILIVKADSGYDTLERLLDDAKSNPDSIRLAEGPLNYQVPASILEEKTGAKFRRLQFEGDAATTTALLGNNVDAAITQLSAVQGQVADGAFKILATATSETDPLTPDVPTFVESGVDLVWTFSSLVVGPEGLPEDVRETLETAFSEAVESDAYVEALETFGISPGTDVGDDINQHLEDRFELASSYIGAR